MSNVLIFAALACALDDAAAAPAEFVFLPEGDHKLTPQSHPKGIRVNMPAEKGAAVAAAFNASLAKRGSVPAWCDFEHSRKHPVSCYPTAFRYEPGKGIMAAVTWSKSGREAVEGRNVRFFSPEFYIGADGVPSGLPDRGPVGGLVTEPAFREIPAIAAADADEPNDSPSMSTLIFAALAITASATNAEADAVTKIEELKVTAGRVPKLEDELKTLKAEVKASKVKAGTALFERAVKAGIAKAADETAKAKYLSAAESNELAFELLTEKVTAAEADETPEGDITRPIIQARDAGQTGNKDQRVSAAQAKARTELGPNAEFQAVWARAAEIDPPAFQ
jgi:hypothetical protein